MTKCAASINAQLKDLLPFFGLPAPFARAVADVLAADTAAGGGNVPHGRTSRHVTGFQEHGARQDRPDTRNGLYERLAWLCTTGLPDRRLDRMNLLLFGHARFSDVRCEHSGY